MKFVTAFAFGCAGTVRILHMDVLDFSVASIGLIMAAYSVLIAVAEVPSGAISDVWGRRKTKLLASWVMAGSYLILGVANSLATVALAAALLGIGRALFSGAADAWFVDEVGDAKDPRVLTGLARGEAAQNIGFGVGSLAGALIPQLLVGVVADRLVFAPVYLLGAVLLIVDIVLTMNKMVERRSADAYPKGGIWRTTLAGVTNALDAPVPRWVAGSMMMVGGAVGCLELLTPLGLGRDLGTERALIVFGPLVAGTWFFSALASILTERFQRWGGSVQRTAGLLLAALALLLLPASLGRWYFAVGAYVAVNFVLGALVPLLASMLHQHVRSSNRSAAASTLSLSTMAGAATASVLVGGLDRIAVLVVALGAVVAATSLLRLARSGNLDTTSRAPDDDDRVANDG